MTKRGSKRVLLAVLAVLLLSVGTAVAADSLPATHTTDTDFEAGTLTNFTATNGTLTMNGSPAEYVGTWTVNVTNGTAGEYHVNVSLVNVSGTALVEGYEDGNWTVLASGDLADGSNVLALNSTVAESYRSTVTLQVANQTEYDTDPANYTHTGEIHEEKLVLGTVLGTGGGAATDWLTATTYGVPHWLAVAVALIGIFVAARSKGQ